MTAAVSPVVLAAAARWAIGRRSADAATVANALAEHAALIATYPALAAQLARDLEEHLRGARGPGAGWNPEPKDLHRAWALALGAIEAAVRRGVHVGDDDPTLGTQETITAPVCGALWRLDNPNDWTETGGHPLAAGANTSGDGIFECTWPPGHPCTQHVAGDGDVVIAVWPVTTAQEGA